MEAKVLSEAKVYVGTYAKYNNGSLFGAWLDLSDYSDKEEFYEACRELHKDEEDAEYMFQDWENVPEGLIYKIPCSGVISRPAASTSCRSFFITSAGIHLRSTLTVRTRLRLRTMSIGA